MIYIIRTGNEDGGYIKIGYSKKSVKKRVKKLQTGSPLPLEIIGTIEGNIPDEKELHLKLARFRVRANGEWFYDCREIREELGIEITSENDTLGLSVDKRAMRYALNDMFKYRDYPNFPSPVSVSVLSRIKGISEEDIMDFSLSESATFFIKKTSGSNLLRIFGKIIGGELHEQEEVDFVIPKKTFNLVLMQENFSKELRSHIQ
jgi:hypothetical protein